MNNTHQQQAVEVLNKSLKSDEVLSATRLYDTTGGEEVTGFAVGIVTTDFGDGDVEIRARYADAGGTYNLLTTGTVEAARAKVEAELAKRQINAVPAGDWA